MFRCLLEQQCVDLSSRIGIQEQNSAIARGTFGDIWRGKLDGRYDVAIKCLRLSVVQESGGKQHEVRSIGLGVVGVIA